jgi:hypothetical protein
MATINKSLTTYLPAQSVEWLESYCLDYKHLQNKDGNPKLGTAIADIIARLADGELALPEKIESQSTAPIQYGTEFITLKGEVEELKKLLNEYGTNKLPDTVLNLETVKHEIEVALEPIRESVSNLDTDLQSLIASLAEPLPRRIARANTSSRKEKPNVDGDTRSWGEFFKMVGIEALTAVEAQKKDNIDIRTEQIEQGLQSAKELGLGDWAVKVAGRSFVRVEELTRA